MQNLRLLSDEILLKSTHELVKAEREVTNRILHYLQEVERRKLYAFEGFSTLFEFCVKRLNYSEAGASRRISAMRLLKDLGSETASEIEAKIETGELTLSTVAQAASFIQREQKITPSEWSHEAKEELLLSLQGQSAREVERHLLSLASPETKAAAIERTRQIDEELIELKVALSSETMALLEQIRGLIAHKNPNPTWAQLIEYLAKTTLEKIDPARRV